VSVAVHGDVAIPRALTIGGIEQNKNYLYVRASVGPASSLQMQVNRLATAAYVALQKGLP